MKKFTKLENGGVSAPKGFLATGVFCDIKRLGTGKGSEKGQKPDLGIILSVIPATAAGMFTSNKVAAAPVRLCVERIKNGVCQVIVANSGNANACTGRQGLADAYKMAEIAAKSLRVPKEHVLVASTGRIGIRLPMKNVISGIHNAVSQIYESSPDPTEFARAIMTSDTRLKQCAVEFKLCGKNVRIGAACKGAGMIHPKMVSPSRLLHATMLAFITTDASIDPVALQAALELAVEQSFNRITVDGDTSTNDTVIALANGLAENPEITADSLQDPNGQQFQSALNFVCLELAKMIVMDGEGASKFVTVKVSGAETDTDALAVARAVANSVLVKTSWNGGDPNWGRIIDAVGYSNATVDEQKIDIGYSIPNSRKVLWACKKGAPTKTSFQALCDVVANKKFTVQINLNLGNSSATMYSTDLSEEYVDFNKGTITDPANLGG